MSEITIKCATAPHDTLRIKPTGPDWPNELQIDIIEGPDERQTGIYIDLGSATILRDFLSAYLCGVADPE